MNSSDLQLLRAKVDSTLRIFFVDGEIVTAKVVFVSDEDRDVIYDIVASNRPDKYSDSETKSAYLANFDDIVSVENIEN
jgi:hypothetical protein